jgi:hypothetical protein
MLRIGIGNTFIYVMVQLAGPDQSGLKAWLGLVRFKLVQVRSQNGNMVKKDFLAYKYIV